MVDGQPSQWDLQLMNNGHVDLTTSDSVPQPYPHSGEPVVAPIDLDTHWMDQLADGTGADAADAVDGAPASAPVPPVSSNGYGVHHTSLVSHPHTINIHHQPIGQQQQQPQPMAMTTLAAPSLSSIGTSGNNTNMNMNMNNMNNNGGGGGHMNGLSSQASNHHLPLLHQPPPQMSPRALPTITPLQSIQAPVAPQQMMAPSSVPIGHIPTIPMNVPMGASGGANNGMGTSSAPYDLTSLSPPQMDMTALMHHAASNEGKGIAHSNPSSASAAGSALYGTSNGGVQQMVMTPSPPPMMNPALLSAMATSPTTLLHHQQMMAMAMARQQQGAGGVVTLPNGATASAPVAIAAAAAANDYYNQLVAAASGSPPAATGILATSPGNPVMLQVTPPALPTSLLHVSPPNYASHIIKQEQLTQLMSSGLTPLARSPADGTEPLVRSGPSSMGSSSAFASSPPGSVMTPHTPIPVIVPTPRLFVDAPHVAFQSCTGAANCTQCAQMQQFPVSTAKLQDWVFRVTGDAATRDYIAAHGNTPSDRGVASYSPTFPSIDDTKVKAERNITASVGSPPTGSSAPYPRVLLCKIAFEHASSGGSEKASSSGSVYNQHKGPIIWQNRLPAKGESGAPTRSQHPAEFVFSFVGERQVDFVRVYSNTRPAPLNKNKTKRNTPKRIPCPVMPLCRLRMYYTWADSIDSEGKVTGETGWVHCYTSHIAKSISKGTGTGNKKRKGGDEVPSPTAASATSSSASAAGVTFAPLPPSGYGPNATATNGTASGSTSPYHPTSNTSSPFSGSSASPASPTSPNGSVSPSLSSPSSPISPSSSEDGTDRPHTKARRVGERPPTLSSTVSGSYVPPALTSATAVDVTQRGAIIPQPRPMMLSDVVVHVMTRDELKHQIVSAIQARPYIGTWMQSPQSVHPPALTLYHPTGMPSWDRTSEVVFFFNPRYCVPALGVSFSPYSTISCFPPHPPNANNNPSSPTSPPSLSSRSTSGVSSPVSPGAMVNLSSTIPPKPSAIQIPNGVLNNHPNAPDAMIPASSSSEASVFVAWLNSPLFYVGKYLYTRAGEPGVSSIMTPVDDGLRDDLEPLTHMVIKLRIPTRDLPPAFSANPVMAGHVMRAMETMLQAWVTYRVAQATVIAERLVILKTLMHVSQRLEQAEARFQAESKRKSLITRELEAVDEKRARGSSLTNSPLLGPRKATPSMSMMSDPLLLDTSARGRPSSRVPVDNTNTSPTSSLVAQRAAQLDGPPEDWPVIKPGANNNNGNNEEETIWTLLRSALLWRYEELERVAKDQRKAAIQASFDAKQQAAAETLAMASQSDMKRSGPREEKLVTVKKENTAMDTSSDDSSAVSSPYSPPTSPETPTSPRPAKQATAAAGVATVPVAGKKGLPSLSAHVVFALVLRDTELLTRFLSLAPMFSPPSLAASRCSYEVYSKPTPEWLSITPVLVAQVMEVEDTAKQVLESCAAAFEQQERDRLNEKLRSGEAMAAMASGGMHGANLSHMVAGQPINRSVGSLSITVDDGRTKGTTKTGSGTGKRYGSGSGSQGSNSGVGSSSYASEDGDENALFRRHRIPSLFNRSFIVPTSFFVAITTAIAIFSVLRFTGNDLKWEDKSTGRWYPVDTTPYVWIAAVIAPCALVGAAIWNSLFMRLWLATCAPKERSAMAAAAAGGAANAPQQRSSNWQLSVQRLLFFGPLLCILGLAAFTTDIIFVNADFSYIAKIVAVTFLTMAAFDVVFPYQWWTWLNVFQPLTNLSLETYKSNRAHIGASNLMTLATFVFQTGIMMLCSVFFVPLFCNQPDVMGTLDANLSLVGLFWLLEVSRNLQHVYNVRLMIRSQYINPMQGSMGLTGASSSENLAATEALQTTLMSNSRFRTRGITPHTRCGELRDIFARRFGTIAMASIFTSFDFVSVFLRKMGRSFFNIGRAFDWIGCQFIRPPAITHSVGQPIPAELREVQNSQALQEFSSVSTVAIGATSPKGAVKSTHFLPNSKSAPLYNPDDSAQSRANSRTTSTASGGHTTLLVAPVNVNAATTQHTGTDKEGTTQTNSNGGTGSNETTPMVSRTVSLVSARTTSTVSAAAPMSSSSSPDHRPLGGTSPSQNSMGLATVDEHHASPTAQMPLTASFSAAERSLVIESKDRLRSGRSSSTADESTVNEGTKMVSSSASPADIDVSWRENKRVYSTAAGQLIHSQSMGGTPRVVNSNDWRYRLGSLPTTHTQQQATWLARMLPSFIGNGIGGFFRLIGWLIFTSIGNLAWKAGEVMQSSTSRHILTVAEWQNVGFAKAASQLSKLRHEADQSQAGEVSWAYSIEDKLVDMGAAIVGFACFLGAFEYQGVALGLGIGAAVYAMMTAFYIVCSFFARLTAHLSLQLVVQQTTPFLVARNRMKEWEHIPIGKTMATTRYNDNTTHDMKCVFCRSALQLSGADTIQCSGAQCRLTVTASHGTSPWDVPKDLLLQDPLHWQLWSRISISSTRLCHVYSSSADSRSAIYHNVLDQIECSPYLSTRFDRRATQSFIISQPETENSFRAFVGARADQVRILLPQIVDENGVLGGTATNRSTVFGAAVSAARHSDIQIIRIYHVVHGEHLDANNEARVERRWLDDHSCFSYAHSLEDAIKSFAPADRRYHGTSGPSEVWVMLSYLAVRRNKSRAGEVARDEDVFTAEMQVQLKPTNKATSSSSSSSSSKEAKTYEQLAAARPSRPISQISQFDRVRLLPRQLLCLRLRPQPMQGGTPMTAVVVQPSSTNSASSATTSSSSALSSSELFQPLRTTMLMPPSTTTRTSAISISMSPVGSSREYTTGGSMGSMSSDHANTSSMTTATGSVGVSRHSFHATGATNSLQSNSSTRGGTTSSSSSPPKRQPIIPAHSHYVTLGAT